MAKQGRPGAPACGKTSTSPPLMTSVKKRSTASSNARRSSGRGGVGCEGDTVGPGAAAGGGRGEAFWGVVGPDAARSDPLGRRAGAGLGVGGGHGLVGRKLAPPRLPPHFVRGHEVVE